MIRLHCTQKLLAKLPLTDDGHLRSRRPSPYAATGNAESWLSGWHANLLTLQRRPCLLLVHDSTRFPVFIPALKKDDLAELDHYFVDSLMNTLLKTGADDDLMRRAHTMLGSLVCDSDCNRSVQGTMNRMGQEIGFYLEDGRVNVAEITGYRVGAWLADRPCTAKGIKGCIWPRRAMHGLLAEPQTVVS